MQEEYPLTEIIENNGVWFCFWAATISPVPHPTPRLLLPELFLTAGKLKILWLKHLFYAVGTASLGRQMAPYAPCGYSEKEDDLSLPSSVFHWMWCFPPPPSFLLSFPMFFLPSLIFSLLSSIFVFTEWLLSAKWQLKEYNHERETVGRPISKPNYNIMISVGRIFQGSTMGW